MDDNQSKFDRFLVESYESGNYRCSHVLRRFTEMMGWGGNVKLSDMGIERVPTVSYFNSRVSVWLFQAYPQFPDVSVLLAEKGRPLSGIRLDLLKFANPYNSGSSDAARQSIKHYHKRIAANQLSNAIYKGKPYGPGRVKSPARKMARGKS